VLCGIEDGLRQRLLELNILDDLRVYEQLDAALSAFGVDMTKPSQRRLGRAQAI
jgi:hypothetical protein